MASNFTSRFFMLQASKWWSFPSNVTSPMMASHISFRHPKIYMPALESSTSNSLHTWPLRKPLRRNLLHKPLIGFPLDQRPPKVCKAPSLHASPFPTQTLVHLSFDVFFFLIPPAIPSKFTALHMPTSIVLDFTPLLRWCHSMAIHSLLMFSC